MSKKIGAAALLAAVAAIALLQSWQRWLDPIIDTGRDLYIPEQLARGAKLYRDLRYQYPPLAPYVLALIPRSLAAYTAFGIAQSAVVAGALWLSLRRYAWVAVLLFLSLSFCGASTWGANFIFPYSYAATIGMAFLMVALAAVLHERMPVALAALLLASWCKVEYAIAVALIVAVLAITRRATRRHLITLFVLWVLSVLFVLSSFPRFAENAFAKSLTEGQTARHFYAVISGTANWPQHLGEIALGALGIAAVSWLLWRAGVSPAGSAASSPPLPPERRRGTPAGQPAGRRRAELALAIAVSLLLASHVFFRAWALLQLAALVYALVKDRRSPLAVFAIFSFAATLRVPLNVSPVWYGFVLLVPTYALIAYVLFDYLPVPRKWAWLPLIVVLCGLELYDQHERWSAKVYPIVSPRGTLYDANPDRAAALNEFIARKPAGTLVVLPEGLTVNYLTQTTTPLSFHTFTPVETADPSIENEILGEISRRPPDRIALVPRDVREYGSRGFGVDYDQRLAAWIRAHYALEWTRKGERYSFAVLHRR